MKPMALTTAALIALGLVAAAQDPIPPAPPPPSPSQIRMPIAEGLPTANAACEAVFRHWWSNLSEAQKASIFEVYLPDSFAAAYTAGPSETGPTFRSRSEFNRAEFNQRQSVYFWECSDTISGGGSDDFRFSASYNCGPTCGLHCQYVVNLRDEKWIVERIGSCSVA